MYVYIYTHVCVYKTQMYIHTCMCTYTYTYTLLYVYTLQKLKGRKEDRLCVYGRLEMRMTALKLLLLRLRVASSACFVKFPTAGTHPNPKP